MCVYVLGIGRAGELIECVAVCECMPGELDLSSSLALVCVCVCVCVLQ